jgi:beta-xylosidase
MISAETEKPVELQRIPLSQNKIELRAECDFRNMTDKATFFYSHDGKMWTPIGGALHMSYTLPHFMGYRFGLFYYSTKNVGGFADFDYFHIEDNISEKQ